MSISRHMLSVFAALVLTTGVASAQDGGETREQSSSQMVVTSSASESGVRFVAPDQARRMRLEVYSVAGERVYDSEFRQGNILDWDGAGVADGSYLCVVTAEDLEGKLPRKFSAATQQGGRVSLGREGEEQLKAQYSQAMAAAGQPTGGDASLAVVPKKSQAVTVAAHDGQDGQVTSTSGALTFRTGNVFSGKDKEQVRITPEGQVGIGTDKPEATLDVAGTIRARGGIVFDDGTVLKSAGGGVVGSTVIASAAGGGDSLNVGGTGTANQLAKWTDGAGTLGDSLISEVGGIVGIGTATPNSNGVLHVNKSQATGTNVFITNDSTAVGALSSVRAGLNPSNYAVDYASLNVLGVGWPTGSGGAFLKGKTALLEANGSNFGIGSFSNTEPIIFYTTSSRLERMRINADGNIGIGTTPTQKLEVAGNVKLTGAGSGIMFPDGTKLTTASGGGGSMSGTSIVSAINDPATVGSIGDNRLPANVARLGGGNVWTGPNVFNVGLSANNAAVTNVGNPVNAGDAVNKAFFNANAVQFVPGAEQLSVGDANGTATMINLRGGSTCCSGPGGHTPAFFKVFQNGSFVATGNLGIGVSPMEGAGYRTSWHTYKGAFRSGYADNEWDDANTGFFSWAGGSNSTASGLYAFAFGDTNFARSTSSIAFGSGNEVKGAAGFSAGAGNRVCDTYGVAFGNKAQSGGPLINGKCDPETFNIRGLAAVAIGYNVTADQDHTTALGKFATNNGFSGTFIWSDGSATASADTFRNTANNEFAARASGGFRFRTNLTGTTGCNLPAGSGVFNCTSSRTTKENFVAVGGEDILSRLRKVPVSTWNYINEGRQSRHMGPMAEDFYSAFGLGTSTASIGVQDLAGVSLAAAQALEQRTAELQKENEGLRSKLSAMEQRLAAIEQAIQGQTQNR